MVYVLLLESGKYYVGYSGDESGRRIDAHYRGAGATWTRVYKPIETIEVIPEGDKALEVSLTARYARQYGWKNVRGGGLTQTNLYGQDNWACDPFNPSQSSIDASATLALAFPARIRS